MSLFTYDNISWNLPLMFCHDELIFIIGDILKEFSDIPHPKLFSYGSITSPWSGGRDTHIKFFNNHFIENHLNKIIESEFIPTFTFTKPFIKKDSLNDKVANWILDYGVEHECEFLVCSELLFNYIKDRHPEAKVSASILQGKMKFHGVTKRSAQNEDDELNFYNEIMDKYNRVVIRPEYALEKLEKDKDRIKDITKFEVHLNETCVPNCPHAISCYSFNGGAQELDSSVDVKLVCGREEFEESHDAKTNNAYTLMMKKEFVDHMVYDLGIKHLKIQGRHYQSSYLYNLVFYYLFDMTGNFQTIYPEIIEKAVNLKKMGIIIPPEQQVVVNQILRNKCIDIL